MLSPSVKSPTVKEVNSVAYLFHNYRNNTGISRWKTKINCRVCGGSYWITRAAVYQRKNKMCHKCAVNRLKESGKKHLGYKNGKHKTRQGYIKILLDVSDPMLKMANKGDNNYVFEHRYIMAKSLGRPLKRTEHVHHLNGIKDDNRLSNLALVDGGNHRIITKLEQIIKRKDRRIKELEEKLNAVT